MAMIPTSLCGLGVLLVEWYPVERRNDVLALDLSCGLCVGRPWFRALGRWLKLGLLLACPAWHFSPLANAASRTGQFLPPRLAMLATTMNQKRKKAKRMPTEARYVKAAALRSRLTLPSSECTMMPCSSSR